MTSKTRSSQTVYEITKLNSVPFLFLITQFNCKISLAVSRKFLVTCTNDSHIAKMAKVAFQIDKKAIYKHFATFCITHVYTGSNGQNV